MPIHNVPSPASVHHTGAVSLGLPGRRIVGAIPFTVHET